MFQDNDNNNANVIRLPTRSSNGNSSRAIEDNGNRKNNFLDNTNIEKAKNEESRIAVSSPFKNGKRNSFFLNPTFYTSDDLRRSGDLISKKTPYGTVRSNTEVSPSRKLNFENKPNPAQQTVERRAPAAELESTPKRTHENVVDIAPAIPKNNERLQTKPIETQSNYVTEPNYQDTHITAPDAGETVNVCNGCFNRSLANEHLETVKLLKERELELERRALDHDSMLFNNMLQSEKKRKELMKSVSKDNKSTIKLKDSASRRKSSANLLSPAEVKPYTPQKNKSESTINLNLLDKIHENSIRKSRERQVKSDFIKINFKENLWMNSTHNKNILDEKERNKSMDRIKSESDAHGKSLLDRIYDNCLNYLSRRNSDNKHAFDYNRSASKERTRKLEKTLEQDPFKPSLEDLPKLANNNSMLDQINDSNNEYASRMNRESVERSRYNRDHSQKTREIMKNNEEFEDRYTETYNQSPYKLNINPEKFKSKAARSFLENMYNNASARNDEMTSSKKNANDFNLDQIANHDVERAKSPMEQYYKTPTKKVGIDDQVDYDTWTNEQTGVFDMINKSAEKTSNERKERARIYENILKRQMEYKSSKAKEEKAQNTNFVESHKILCSHNSNVMYCSSCNRKYPMNKITKMLSNYKKQKNH